MRFDEVLGRISDEDFMSDYKKRFACAHCGKTWVEIVGLFAGLADGRDELYFQVGNESETCQSCRNRPRSCPECGSKDAYEIKFKSNSVENTPLSFEAIRLVSRG